jgi:DNA repair exonuclease SbcCD nuclease subunit
VKKVLFIGDNHISDKTPENRTDNYLVATIRKLKECLNIAKELNVDAIVFLGDFFDRRIEGPAAVNESIKALISDDYGNPWPFPKYIVIGNHDIQSSFPLDHCSLGTLINSGLLIKTDYEPDLGIAFAHFSNDLDSDITKGLLTNNSAIIWACHASISDKPGRQEEHMIVFSKIPLHPNNSIVISGHIHHPMECMREDNKIFVNPGCIGRRAATKDNFDRDLKIFYLEYELDGTIITKDYIVLESAKNYKEVFKVEEIFARKEEQKEVKEFIKQVASIKAHNWMHNSMEDKLKALRDLGKKSNLDDDIIDIAVEAVKTVGEQ